MTSRRAGRARWSFGDRYGPWAVVTGAAEGLGAAFAEELASRGLHLLVVDRKGELLASTAARLRRRGVEARSLEADLATASGVDATVAASADLDVGLLVCSAGVAPIGPFLDEPREGLEELLATNCRAPMLLCHALCPRLRDRGRGGVVLVSSLSGLHGTALVAAYAATKAFALVLGEGLWEELRGQGVDLLTACLGPTRTPGWERSSPRIRGLARPHVMEAPAVAAETLDALATGRGPTLFPGPTNRLAAALSSRLLPRRLAVSTMGHMMRSLYGG